MPKGCTFKSLIRCSTLIRFAEHILKVFKAFCSNKDLEMEIWYKSNHVSVFTVCLLFALAKAGGKQFSEASMAGMYWLFLPKAALNVI